MSGVVHLLLFCFERAPLVAEMTSIFLDCLCCKTNLIVSVICFFIERLSGLSINPTTCPCFQLCHVNY